MARFSIYSANGQTIRFTGSPIYNGSYMKPSYIEFREISSPAPINWSIGDYVDYTRTGMRYKLYNIPQPTKKARTNQAGDAYVYSNVQFYADTKKLDIALFRDLVPFDNQIHFSTQQAISVYDNVDGIAERLQACMDEFDSGAWSINVIHPSDNCGSVDMGTLNWVYTAPTTGYPYGFLVANIENKKVGARDDAFCNGYVSGGYFTVDKSCICNSGGVQVYIVDSAFSNASAFKSAMSGNMLYYQRTTDTSFSYNEKDYEYEKLITEDREYTMSGGTVLDALQKIYDTWDEVGWVHTIANGVNVITIGKTHSATADQKTKVFYYGKGLGLKQIKRTQANKDSMATRLYIYGSNRNMYPGYYRGKEILDADSVDIQNLMIPISTWGTTEDPTTEELLPDAKKAFIEDASAVAEYGMIPKSAYFTGGDYEEIYPSIKGATIKQIRDAKAAMQETEYVPKADVYTVDGERVDEIEDVTNPTDDGTTTAAGQSYTDIETDDYGGTMISCSFAMGEMERIKEADTNYLAGTTSGGYTSTMTIKHDSVTGTLQMDANMNCTVALIVTVGGKEAYAKNLLQGKAESGTYSFSNEDIEIKDVGEGVDIDIKVKLTARNIMPDAQHGATVSISAGTAVFSFVHSLPPSFSLVLKQIGFNIAERADLGDGKIIHFLDGNCAGRSFKIKRVGYQSATDTWFLWMYRGYDEDLSLYFPNSVYPIAAGDHFVLLDIAMPELYIGMASQRLLTKGRELLGKTARIEPYYEPDVDAIQMDKDRTAHPNDESYVLREGKFFAFSDSDISAANEVVLIDSLVITEGDAIIPTYKVSLREKKAVTFQQTTANTIKTLEQKVIDTSGTMKSVNFDSTDYNDLENLPSIDGIEVKGAKASYADFGLLNKSMIELVSQGSGAQLLQYLQVLHKLVCGDISADDIVASSFTKQNGTHAQLLRANGDAEAITTAEIQSALGSQFVNVVNAINALTSSGLMRFTMNSQTPVSIQRLRQVQFVVDNVTVGTYDPESTASGTQQIRITTSGGVEELNDLSDVNIQTPQRGQILAYNYTQREWYNADPTLTLSDINLKNIHAELNSEDAIERIKHIKGYRFAYKDRPDDERIGFIAQEWETEYPQVVKEQGDVKMMDYNATTAILLSAVKALTAKVDRLESEISALKGE